MKSIASQYYSYLYAAVVSDLLDTCAWVALAEKLIMLSSLPKQWVIDMSYLRSNERADLYASLVSEIGLQKFDEFQMDDTIISFLYIKHLSASNGKEKFMHEVASRGMFQDHTFSELKTISMNQYENCVRFINLIKETDFLKQNPWIYEQASS